MCSLKSLKFSQTDQFVFAIVFVDSTGSVVSALDGGLVRYETVQRLEISYNTLQCDRLDIGHI